MLATFGSQMLRSCSVGRRKLCVCAVKASEKSAAPQKPPKAIPSKAAPAKAAPAKAAKPKPEKISRAPSAYNLFIKANYASFKRENPGKSFAEMAKVVRDNWLSSPPDVKRPFEDEAKKLKAAVAEKRAEMKANARPPNAYIIFVTKQRGAVVAANPGKSATEVVTLLGQAWKDLPKEEQGRYKDEAAKLLKEWETKKGPVAA